MGYILPVTQYEYINYQKRIAKTKDSPHHIDVLHKVVLEPKHNKMKRNDHNKDITIKSYSNKDDNFEQVYTQLTGKGKYLNVDV